MSTPPAGATGSRAVPAGGTSSAAGAPAPAAPELADRVRDVALALPGVAGLSGGPFGTVATHLPGRRVSGVAVHEDGSVEVALVARAEGALRTDLRALAARVAAAVGRLAPGPVSVTIADLEVPEPDVS